MENSKSRISHENASRLAPQHGHHRKVVRRCAAIAGCAVDGGFNDLPIAAGGDPVDAGAACRIGAEAAGGGAFVFAALWVGGAEGIHDGGILTVDRVKERLV